MAPTEGPKVDSFTGESGPSRDIAPGAPRSVFGQSQEIQAPLNHFPDTRFPSIITL
jgi:hypothetical protein